MRTALEGSLKRLNTDYVDLYQLHWPNRGSYHFRQNWNYDPTKQDTSAIKENIYEVLGYLSEKVNEGKIRAIGLSNESAWGTMEFIKTASENNFQKIVSIQNEYSLLCRYFDTDLAELCHSEKINLLAYSPLAAGLLTGKYADGKVPNNS
ncbi:MAG: aldo/keto reductase, partial [Paracoccaceae bacterium]